MTVPHQRPDDPAGELSAWLRFVAPHLSPQAARMVGELDASLQPAKPGPSRKRQAKLAERNDALRSLRRRHYGDLSDRGAAEMLARDADRYVSTGTFDRDRAKGFVPDSEPRRSLYCILVEHGSIPGAEAIKKILREH